MVLAGGWGTWGCFVIEWFDVSRQGSGVMSSVQEGSSGDATFGMACSTTCGVGVGSEVSGGSFLAIVCVGGEGGGSILLSRVIDRGGRHGWFCNIF